MSPRYIHAIHAPDPYRDNRPRCNANGNIVEPGTDANCRRCLTIIAKHAPDHLQGLLMAVVNWHQGFLFPDQLHTAVDRYLVAVND